MFVLSIWIDAEPNFITLLQEEVALAIKKKKKTTTNNQPTTTKFKNSPAGVGG